MKNLSLALGVAALVAVLAACGGGNAGSQLPSPGAMQLTSYHQPATSMHVDLQPDTGRNANWWAYYYCTYPNSICRYHTSNYYGQVTTYLRATSWTHKGQPLGPLLATLMTGNSTLTGNLTDVTLTDIVNVTTSGEKTNFGKFQYGGEPYCSDGAKPSVRFFLTSGGLFAYTHYWWSNPESWTLAKQGTASTIQQAVDDPADWSDWNASTGAQEPTRFANAIAHVRWVGLSFGGGCFFENGVDVSGPKRAIFNSTFTESTPTPSPSPSPTPT